MPSPTSLLRRRGFTLLEMIVVFTLLLAVVGLIATIVPTYLEGTQAATIRSRLQQDALVILGKIESDVRQSAIPAMTSLSPASKDDPVALAIQTLEEGAYPGFQLWRDHLIVYAWFPRDRTFIRKRWPPPPGSGPTLSTLAPVSCTAADVRSIVESRNGTEAVLSRSVCGFSLTPQGPGTWQVALDLEAPVNGRRSEQLHAARTILARNRQ